MKKEIIRNLLNYIHTLESRIEGQQYAIEHLKKENKKLRHNLEWANNRKYE